MLSQLDHIVNPQLLTMVRRGLGGFNKLAFVPGADMSGGGGGASQGDPSQGGGAPPPQGGGMPGGGGGGDPTPPGGGGGDPAASLMPMVQQMVQQQMAQMGGGMGGGAGGAGGKNPLTPKIDEKAVLLQILKIQARIADQLGVKIPASEMVVTQSDMQGLAQSSSSGAPLPGMDPSAGGGAGAGGGGAIGGIPPMDPMAGAGVPGGEKTGNFKSNGVPFDRSQLADVHDRAAAIGQLRRSRPRVSA